MNLINSFNYSNNTNNDRNRLTHKESHDIIQTEYLSG